jgi:tetratricopeptide (TPR) repeat protein
LLLSSCSGDSGRYRHALGLYHDSEFPEAFDAFAALEKSKDPKVQLAAGNAAYRVNRYEDAEKSYRHAAGDRGIIGKAARFNLGNSWFRAAQATPQREYEFYGNAIAAYEEVLRIDPGDDDARWNLELALRKQAEYSTGGSPGRGGRAQAGAGDGNEQLDSEQEQAVGAMAGGGSGDAAGESAEELSTDEARRLLEQVEREQLSEHEARPARRGTRAERDW